MTRMQMDLLIAYINWKFRFIAATTITEKDAAEGGILNTLSKLKDSHKDTDMDSITSIALQNLQNHPAIPFEVDIALGGTRDMQSLCFLLAKHAGWHDNADYTDKREVATKLALIHSEVSEALEAHRKGDADSHLHHRSGIEVELADAVIRIFDLAGALHLNLGATMIEKLAWNAQREDHKRENRAKPGGKSY